MYFTPTYTVCVCNILLLPAAASWIPNKSNWFKMLKPSAVVTLICACDDGWNLSLLNADTYWHSTSLYSSPSLTASFLIHLSPQGICLPFKALCRRSLSVGLTFRVWAAVSLFSTQILRYEVIRSIIPRLLLNMLLGLHYAVFSLFLCKSSMFCCVSRIEDTVLFNEKLKLICFWDPTSRSLYI